MIKMKDSHTSLKIRSSVVIGLFALEFFRVPLFAAFNLREVGSILHIVTFLSPLIMYRNFSFDLRKFYLFSLLTIWSLLASAVLFYKGLDLKIWLEMVAPITMPFLFVMGILFFSNDKKIWLKVTKTILSIGFYGGSLYLLGEWFFIAQLKWMSQCEWASFVTNAYNIQYCDTNRVMPVGFFVYKDMSLAIIMAGFFSFENWKDKRLILLRTALLLFSVLSVDSLILSGVFLLVLPIRFWSSIRGNLVFPLFLILSFVNIFLYSKSFVRIRDYLVNELNLNNFIPTVSGCSKSTLFFQLDGAWLHCHSKEVHSLLYLFKFGVLATFSWYFIFLWMLLLCFKDWIRFGNLATLMFFPLVFIFNAVHYSGAESWGVNFLIFLIFYLYLMEKRDEKLTSIGLESN